MPVHAWWIAAGACQQYLVDNWLIVWLTMAECFVIS